MDTAMVLLCPPILEQTQSNGKHGNGYQDLYHHLLIIFLKEYQTQFCTATARTCQQDCHDCSLVQLSVATTIIILSAQLKLTLVDKNLVSMCEL